MSEREYVSRDPRLETRSEQNGAIPPRKGPEGLG
jgi:hypothetical protein